MILNNLVFPIKLGAKFVEGSIPTGYLTANDINKDMVYVISPEVGATNITLTLQNSKQSEKVVRAFMKPSNISVDMLVSKDESYYDLIKDWNVWQCFLPSKALAFVSYNRANQIGISFGFRQATVPRIEGFNFIGNITSSDFIPNQNGYYINKTALYIYNGLELTYNDVLIKQGNEFLVRKAIITSINTSTLEYDVDPSVYDSDIETIDIGIAESLILQANGILDDINFINFRLNDIYKKDETYNKDEVYSKVEMDLITSNLYYEINRLDDEIIRVEQKVDTHIEDLNNPHEVTAEQVDTYVKTTIDNKDANTLQEAKDYTYNKSTIDGKLATKVDKTQKIIGLDLQDDILLTEFKTALGNATQSVAGLLSAEDKTHLDGLVALLENSDGNNVVDTIGEILEIFNNYPEGADLVTVLNGKVDKVAGKALSQNDFTDALKNKLDGLLNGSQYYDKNYIDALKDQNGWESELLGTLSNNGTIALSVINQYDEIQMYAKDTLGVIDNENIRPSLMQSGDSVYFFDDTQAFIMVDTVFGFYAPVGYTLQVVGIKYTELKASDVATLQSGISVQDKLDDIDLVVEQKTDKLESRQVGETTIQRNSDCLVIKVTNPTVTSTPLYVNGKLVSLNETYNDGKTYETTFVRDSNGLVISYKKEEVI